MLLGNNEMLFDKKEKKQVLDIQGHIIVAECVSAAAPGEISVLFLPHHSSS